MKKYWTVFKLSLSNQFVYRLNFVFSQLRQIIVLLLLYYVWVALTASTGRFAQYSFPELMTYIFGVVLLRPFIFGSQSREMASEINNGMFSNYLMKPVNPFFYFYAREAAERLVLFGTAVIEVGVLAKILHAPFLYHFSSSVFFIFCISIFLAHILYYLLSYCVSLLAFWSREAHGPRFFFEWVLEFASGAYFPLSIVSAGFFTLLSTLPFFYLIFAPMSLYLGKMDNAGFVIGMQMFWIVVVGALTWFTWKRGIERYTGEGI